MPKEDRWQDIGHIVSFLISEDIDLAKEPDLVVEAVLLHDLTVLPSCNRQNSNSNVFPVAS
jgi:hypothetical protein